jgi:hypothetical protein
MLTEARDDVGPVAAESGTLGRASAPTEPEAEVAVCGGLRRLRQLGDDQRMSRVDRHH